MARVFFTEVNRPFVLRYDLPEPLDVSFWAMATFRHLTFTQSLSNIETLNLVFNGPLWSLVLEMYFYLCFPLLLILLRKINTKVRVAFAFVGFYLLQVSVDSNKFAGRRAVQPAESEYTGLYESSHSRYRIYFRHARVQSIRSLPA